MGSPYIITAFNCRRYYKKVNRLVVKFFCFHDSQRGLFVVLCLSGKLCPAEGCSLITTASSPTPVQLTKISILGPSIKHLQQNTKNLRNISSFYTTDNH